MCLWATRKEERRVGADLVPSHSVQRLSLSFALSPSLFLFLGPPLHRAGWHLLQRHFPTRKPQKHCTTNCKEIFLYIEDKMSQFSIKLPGYKVHNTRSKEFIHTKVWPLRNVHILSLLSRPFTLAHCNENRTNNRPEELQVRSYACVFRCLLAIFTFNVTFSANVALCSQNNDIQSATSSNEPTTTTTTTTTTGNATHKDFSHQFRLI